MKRKQTTTQPLVLKEDLDDLSTKRYLKSPFLAVDTETLGLNLRRDRLCVVQMCDVSGFTTLVQIQQATSAPNLKRVLESVQTEKIFHFARFDVAMLRYWLDIHVHPVYCTKIASKLTRTYTDQHGLKELTREFLTIEMDKQQQSSDWAAQQLSAKQVTYAAADVVHLIEIKKRLDRMLEREERITLARDCMAFIPTRAALDLAGWQGDIFSH